MNTGSTEGATMGGRVGKAGQSPTRPLVHPDRSNSRGSSPDKGVRTPNPASSRSASGQGSGEIETLARQEVTRLEATLQNRGATGDDAAAIHARIAHLKDMLSNLDGLRNHWGGRTSNEQILRSAKIMMRQQSGNAAPKVQGEKHGPGVVSSNSEASRKSGLTYHRS